MLFRHGFCVMCCGIECGRRMGEVLECLEVTRVSAVTHVCDCGVVWRIIVLGAERLRAGARACFVGRGGGGSAVWGGWICDVVVTP